MSREGGNLVKVYLTKANSSTLNTAFSDTTYQEEVTKNSSSATLSGIAGITITLTEPDWILGLKQQKPTDLKVTTVPVQKLNLNGKYDDIYWGDITYSDGVKITGGVDGPTQSVETTSTLLPYSTSINNSKLAAEFEYFSHGERGDQYRMVGWPDYVPTKYLVDPNNAYGYDFITVHYAYVGPNEGAQKSEKDLTIIALRDENDSTPSSLGDVATSVLNNINAVASGPIDSRYVKVPASTDFATGELAEFTASGQIKKSGKTANDIS